MYLHYDRRSKTQAKGTQGLQRSLSASQQQARLAAMQSAQYRQTVMSQSSTPGTQPAQSPKFVTAVAKPERSQSVPLAQRLYASTQITPVSTTAQGIPTTTTSGAAGRSYNLASSHAHLSQGSAQPSSQDITCLPVTGRPNLSASISSRPSRLQSPTHATAPPPPPPPPPPPSSSSMSPYANPMVSSSQPSSVNHAAATRSLSVPYAYTTSLSSGAQPSQPIHPQQSTATSLTSANHQAPAYTYRQYPTALSPSRASSTSRSTEQTQITSSRNPSIYVRGQAQRSQLLNRSSMNVLSPYTQSQPTAYSMPSSAQTPPQNFPGGSYATASGAPMAMTQSNLGPSSTNNTTGFSQSRGPPVSHYPGRGAPSSQGIAHSVPLATANEGLDRARYVRSSAPPSSTSMQPSASPPTSMRMPPYNTTNAQQPRQATAANAQPQPQSMRPSPYLFPSSSSRNPISQHTPVGPGIRRTPFTAAQLQRSLEAVQREINTVSAKLVDQGNPQQSVLQARLQQLRVVQATYLSQMEALNRSVAGGSRT